jgi:hypothetical protein
VLFVLQAEQLMRACEKVKGNEKVREREIERERERDKNNNKR